MSSAPPLLEAREGRTLTDVLSAIVEAEYHEQTQPRQKELSDRLPITKGAVSNNCNKLIEHGVIREREDHRYTIVEEELIGLYRAHIDSFLTRESASDRFDVGAVNTIRTATKRGLLTELDDHDLVLDILVEAFVAARDNSRIQTLREVMRHADALVQSMATHVVTHPDFEGETDPVWNTIKPIIQLAVVLEHTHADLDRLVDENPELEQYFPGETPAATMTTLITKNP